MLKDFVLKLYCLDFINSRLADIYLEEQAPPEVALTYAAEDSFKCANCEQYLSSAERDLTYANMCQTCVHYLHEQQTAND